MSGEFPTMNGVRGQYPGGPAEMPSQTEQAGQAGQTAQAGQTEAVSASELMGLFSAKSLTAVQSKTEDKNEIEIPMIDSPDVKITVKIDVVRMTAILAIEADGEQAKNIQDLIKNDQGNIKSRNEQRMKKIEDSLKKMDEAAKASLFNKIFGWVMVAVAAIAAVALSVVSGGVALGPVIGAAIALTFQVMNETKVTEKITKAIADSIQNTFGCDKATAKMWATIVWTGVQLAASILGGIGADKIAGAAMKGVGAAGTVLRTAKYAFNALSDNMQTVFRAVGTVTAELAIIGQVWSTSANYASGMAQADVTQFSALIKLLQQRLEEDEEMLKQLMQLLNGAPVDLEKMLGSALEAMKLIGENMGGAISYS